MIAWPTSWVKLARSVWRPLVAEDSQLGRLLHRIAANMVNDRIPGRAAQMSFYFFLSVFPFLLILVATLGLFLDAQSLLGDSVLSRLMPLLPPSILQIYSDLLGYLAAHSDAPLALGIAIALWSSSSGMVSTADGLDQAYQIADRRPWWKRRLVGFAMTLCLMLIVAAATTLLTFGVPMAEGAAARAGLESAFVLGWRIAQWPLLLAITMLTLDLLYHFGPSRRPARWRWFPVGTWVAMLLWLGATLGLRFYMIRFGNYSVVYGTLGGVIVLLMWFYVTAMAILIGAEINAFSEQGAHAHRPQVDAPITA